MNALTSVLFALLIAQVTPPVPQTPAAPVQPARPEAPGAPQGRYQIGPDDQLKITVYESDELTSQYRVDGDGFITFPLLGRIAVAGMTVTELQDRLKSMLSAGYIRNPQIRVDVEEYKSQRVFVSGEVRAPNEIRMTGAMTLLKALAQAGSPTSAASSELTIARQKKTPPGQAAAGSDAAEVIRVNWRDLQTGKASDIPLQDGDVIFVPKAQMFYIDGYVRNPGGFVLEPGMTIGQAIALAGGLTERGSNRGIKATRQVAGRSIQVDVGVSDKVQADDIIHIRQRMF